MTDRTNYHNGGDDWPDRWQGPNTPVVAGELYDAIADLVAIRRQPWRQHAACRGVGPALFYPDQHDMLTAQTAAGICDTCPVADHCRNFAVDNNERRGIWGGASGDTIRRGRLSDDPTRRGIQPPKPIDHGTENGYRMHVRRNEPVCDACRAGRNASRRAIAAAKRAA